MLTKGKEKRAETSPETLVRFANKKKTEEEKKRNKVNAKNEKERSKRNTRIRFPVGLRDVRQRNPRHGKRVWKVKRALLFFCEILIFVSFPRPVVIRQVISKSAEPI